MLVVVLVLLMLIISSAKFAPAGEFYSDYNSKEKTTMIKGIFVFLVYCSHFTNAKYNINLESVLDEPYLIFKINFGQMVVAMFLFYSGFGIMESITKKGFNYVKSIPYKRFLRVLLNFDIAVLLFLVVQFFIGKTFTLKTILFSLIGYKSIGNSNWYIFVTLVLYLLVFLSFLLIKIKKNKITLFISLLLLFALTVLFVYSQIYLDRLRYTYNTAIIFVFGCFYSYFKPYFDKIVTKNGFVYLAVCLAITCIGLFAFNHKSENLIYYSFWGVSFVLAVVLLTMKITIANPLFKWFGNHVFSISILQRIPMTLLHHFKFGESHKWESFIIALISTCVLAVIFDFFTGKLQKLIWKK